MYCVRKGNDKPIHTVYSYIPTFQTTCPLFRTFLYQFCKWRSAPLLIIKTGGGGGGGTSPLSGPVHCHRQGTIINNRYHRPYVVLSSFVVQALICFIIKVVLHGKKGLKQLPVI